MIVCTSSRRRELIEDSTLLGIDFIEVDPDDRRRLLVYLLEKSPGISAPTANEIAGNITLDQIRFTGGIRRELEAVELTAETDDFGIDHLVVVVESLGDRSTYRLTIDDDRFDRKLNTVRFSFTATCPTIGDCEQDHVHCPSEEGPTPRIDYLAKDYATFRQLLIDHLDRSTTEWGGAHPADFTTAVLEVLAYEADRLSYMQDAAANERTLATARLRESAVRHARLVDYHADDGSSARAFLRVRVSGAATIEPYARAFTRVDDPNLRLPPGLSAEQANDAARLASEAFEVMPRTRARDASDTDRAWHLDETLNAIPFHTWGEDECSLPAGATEAVLSGDITEVLHPGDFLGMREMRGPADGDEPGHARDADPEQVFLVRLTDVAAETGDEVVDPSGEPLTRVRWHREDALARGLCIVDGHVGSPRAEAFGNVVLVEHGTAVRQSLDLPADFSDPDSQWPTVYRQKLDTTRLLVSRDDGDVRECGGRRRQPLTLESERLDEVFATLPASHHLVPDPAGGAARVDLVELPDDVPWKEVPNTLRSQGDDPHFVIERDSDGSGWVRFGDGERGRRPAEISGATTEFEVEYRYGDAAAGNVAADTIAHIEADSGASSVLSVTNPLAAAGGRHPESIDSIKQEAPRSLRETERAVRPEDYAGFATELPAVQRARARFEWTGSWITVGVVADARGAAELSPEDTARLRRCLEEVRLAGYPVEVDPPVYVPIELDLGICMESAHEPYEVLAEVGAVLGSTCDSTGTPGFFHPDRLSFGQPIWLSDIVATASKVEGVASIRPHRFKRQYSTSSALTSGVIEMQRFEIARLDNDPAQPEHGTLRLEMENP
jgi:hypothetical protein